jgi:hypothetical protein
MYECSKRVIRVDTTYKKHYWRVFKRKGDAAKEHILLLRKDS